MLSRPSIYLGRRADADRDAPLSTQTAICRLRFVERWWHLDNLQNSEGLRVNGERCTSRRLQPRDELAIGRVRYRIDYSPPNDTNSNASDLLEQIAESVLAGDQKPQPAAPARCGQAPQNSESAREVVRVQERRDPPFLNSAMLGPSLSAAEPGEVLGRLVPLGGGPDHPLLKPKITIGRRSPCDIVLRVRTVSTLHCMLELIEGYWQVTDQESRNGVRLDSVRCRQAWVFPDSRLSIGDQRFRLDYTPTGEPPVPHVAQQPSLMAKAGITGEELERLSTRQDRERNQGEDSERKRWELLEDL